VSLTCPSTEAVRRLALGSVAANVAIVVTGGAVRLTDSGLGCPTWPRCTAGSYAPTAARSVHGQIEFGNRTLTFVVGLVALATLVAVILHRPRRRPLVVLATLAFLGIPAQAVLGGVTVLTGLNPWTVAAHFLLSTAIVGVTVLLWWRARERYDSPPRPVTRPELVLLGRVLVAVAAAVVALGTVVTGSGPHAGDTHARRTGLDPETVAQVHADGVMLLIGLSIATAVALHAVRAPRSLRRAAATLVGVELAQGVIGYVQYFTGLPVALVGVHLLGAQLVWIAALLVLLRMRARVPAPSGGPEPEPAAAAGLVSGSWWMPATSRRRSGKAEEEADSPLSATTTTQPVGVWTSPAPPKTR
jgi:heme a synthase